MKTVDDQTIKFDQASTLDVQELSWQQSHAELSQLRQIVFIQEQGVSENDEWDGLDPLANTRHFAVFFSDGFTQPPLMIACARILNNGKIGRMAVLKPWRRKGVGSRLLQCILQHLLQQQFESNTDIAPNLNAQLSAIAFYQNIGFVATGKVFLDAGIEHKKMQVNLEDKNTLKAIYGDTVNRLNTPSAFIMHLRQAIIGAQRSLYIVCSTLEPLIWADKGIHNAISKLARRSRESKVQILVRDSKLLNGSGHPLLKLSQRLSSRVSIRVIDRDVIFKAAAFSCSDKEQLIYWNDEPSYRGFANYAAAAESRPLLDEFERIWEHSSYSDPNLVKLYL